MERTKRLVAFCLMLHASAVFAQEKDGVTLEKGPTRMRAREVTGFPEGVMRARGDVQVVRDKDTLFADELEYDRVQDRVRGRGHVRLCRGDGEVSGEEIDYSPSREEGKITESQFRLSEKQGRGTAKEVQILGKEKVRMRSAAFTSCEKGVDDWFLRSQELTFNRTTNVATARHARLEFFDVPVAYVPYISFNTKRERKTGFLFPSLGNSGSNGFEFRAPFYWNIAPNMDDTIAPNFMSKRGVQVQNEFRYMDRRYSGTFRGEFLPDALDDHNRYAYTVQHTHNLGSGLSLYANVQGVSDDEYFRDVSYTITETSRRQLPRDVQLGYAGHGIQASLRAQEYQTLTEDLTDPYRRLPQARLSGERRAWGVQWGLDSEFVRFENKDSDLVTGNRSTFYPQATLPLRSRYGYVEPKVGVHYTRYDLDDPRGEDRGANRALPVLSVLSGLEAERGWDVFGGHYTQTLEPQLFYLYIPYRNQNRLPLFDTALQDIYDFAELFDENRFVGGDRINDANEGTASVSSRLLDSEGKERLRGGIGERMYFSNMRVMADREIQADGATELLAQLQGQVTDAWWLDGFTAYNHAAGKGEKYAAALRYNPGPGYTLNAGYRYSREFLEQLDFSGEWPVIPHLYLLGRWNYSLRSDQLLEGLAGLEYNAGCWAVRFVAHRYAVYEDHTETHEGNRTRFMLQVELAGLSQFGSDPLGLLRGAIRGYTPSTALTANP